MNEDVRATIEEFLDLATLVHAAMSGQEIPDGKRKAHPEIEHDIYEIAFGRPGVDFPMNSIYARVQANEAIKDAVDEFASKMDMIGTWPVTDYLGENDEGHLLYVGFEYSAAFRTQHLAWRENEQEIRRELWGDWTEDAEESA
jgi:hypothetical protein